MKKLAMLFGAVLLVMATWANAQTVKNEIGEAKFDNAVANYLVALKSDNDGLRRSAIYMLGQLEAKEAVIPMMKVLRGSKDPGCRIAAAWALSKIGGSVGTYAVKQAVRFDDDLKVKTHAAWYYNLYVSPGTFAFIPSSEGTTQIAELR
jgi:3-methyladenine DNA glycosylase AlkD